MTLSIPVIFLVAAALLGFVIGWFFNRIQAIRTYNMLAEDSEARARKMNRQIQSLTEENTDLADSLRMVRSKLSSYESTANLAAAKAKEHDANLKRKDQRIDELESQAYASEEQHMRVQRDFAKFRLYKTREVQQLQQQLLARGETATASVDSIIPDGEVPVLKKKATIEPSASSRDKLPDITHEVLESDEDLMDMTSEFDFDPEELLADD